MGAQFWGSKGDIAGTCMLDNSVRDEKRVMSEITKEIAVVLSMSEPSPIGFLNLYNEGDEWVKIQGCEKCAWEARQNCCGRCRMLTSKGCFLHMDGGGQNKPYYCVINPSPKQTLHECALAYKCVKGPKEGLIRRVCDPTDIFVKE